MRRHYERMKQLQLPRCTDTHEHHPSPMRHTLISRERESLLLEQALLETLPPSFPSVTSRFLHVARGDLPDMRIYGYVWSSEREEDAVTYRFYDASDDLLLLVGWSFFRDYAFAAVFFCRCSRCCSPHTLFCFTGVLHSRSCCSDAASTNVSLFEKRIFLRRAAISCF